MKQLQITIIQRRGRKRSDTEKQRNRKNDFKLRQKNVI